MQNRDLTCSCLPLRMCRIETYQLSYSTHVQNRGLSATFLCACPEIRIETYQLSYSAHVQNRDLSAAFLPLRLFKIETFQQLSSAHVHNRDLSGALLCACAEQKLISCLPLRDGHQHMQVTHAPVQNKDNQLMGRTKLIR